MSQELPARCCAAEIAAALTDVAWPGSRVLVNRPVQRWGESAVWVTTGSLWRIGLWRREGDGLVMTLEAVSPDRRHWARGCERRWLDDGGVIEPLELLGNGVREQLDERLLSAKSWPQTAMCPMWLPSALATR